MMWTNLFDKIVKEKTQTWNAFHDYWINKSLSKEVPVFFFRYEDMLLHPSRTLE